MKLTNIKLTVETDGQNQYVLKQHIGLNKECAWSVYLGNGDDYWNTQSLGNDRAICSVWKGFRHLVINANGHLILCACEKYYDDRDEKEITFAEFKAMCEPHNQIKELETKDDGN